MDNIYQNGLDFEQSIYANPTYAVRKPNVRGTQTQRTR